MCTVVNSVAVRTSSARGPSLDAIQSRRVATSRRAGTGRMTGCVMRFPVSLTRIRIRSSYELGKAAGCGVERYRDQKHGEGRGEPFGTHPCGESATGEAAHDRGQSSWTP